MLKENGIEKPIDINRYGIMGMQALTGLTGGTGNGGMENGKNTMLPKKPKCSTRKYACPSCGNSFRATPGCILMED